MPETPTITSSSTGGFVVAWGQLDAVVTSNGWDVFARVFSGSGVGGQVNRIEAQRLTATRLGLV